MEHRFTKMHGLGNDFVVLDVRETGLVLRPEQIRAIANRRTGVGCDQFIVIEPAKDAHADVFMRILNADGSEVEACGNATRCIADLVMEQTGRDHTIIETVVGLLDAHPTADGRISVDMGPVKLDWREIPLADPVDTGSVPLEVGPLANPVAVNVGNPHAVFFVDDAEAVDLERWGPQIETHEMFPARINVEVVQVLNDSQLRMRVWERGVGITQACGTGACASLVAAARRKLTGRRAEVILDGGPLEIEWMPDNTVQMTGPVARSFSGVLDPSLLG